MLINKEGGRDAHYQGRGVLITKEGELFTKEVGGGAHHQGKGVLITKERGCLLPRRGGVLITKKGCAQ